MVIKKHPEWMNHYPAIDGIVKNAKEEVEALQKKFPETYVAYQGQEKPIRSDIEEILKLDNAQFREWYDKRKNATENMLNQYKIIGSIPALCYGSEERKFNLSGSNCISSPIQTLKYGLDYLEKIKEVREEYRK